MIAKVKRILGRLAAAVAGPRATGSASASGGRTVVGRIANPSHGPSSPPSGRTGPQVIGASGLGPLGGPASLAPRLAAGYETYRRMRRDPTIALARALAVAPVVAGKWTVQADADVPQEVRAWIDKQFLTVREPLLETILKHGYVDFGHQGFELIWGLDANGRQCVVRFKPLLPDITEILIDAHGGLAGLRQKNVELTGTRAMLVSFGGEGSNFYGEPLLENVREAWNDWRKANEVAARYDRKIAGAYLVLHYPSFGQGIDQNGAKLDNVYLAQRILDKLEAASGVAIGDVPSELAPGQDPNQTAWRLEVQGSAGGQQQGFVDRLRYLDSLKVRGMLLPERAILEGQHGTLAESQSQGDLALLQAELVHHHLTREINRQAVDPVLEANWGPAYRGKVRLEAAPLSDANQGFLRQLVTQVLADPKDFADLFHRADWPAIFDAVGLPQTKASTALSGPSTIISAIGQLQREAIDGAGSPNWRPSHRGRYSTAGLPKNDLAVQPRDMHIEGASDDALGLANFNPNEPRDKRGRWCKGGSDAVDATGAAGETGAADEKGAANTAPPLLPATGVGDPGSFFKWWKEQTFGLGKDQIDAFRKTLENGCIGVVATYLGYTDPADPNGKFASQFTEGYKTFREAERDAKSKKCCPTGPGQDVYGAPLKPVVVAVMFEYLGLPPGKDWREQMAFRRAHPDWKADATWLNKRPLDASQHWNDVKGKGGFNFAVYVPDRQVWLARRAEKPRPVVPFDNSQWRSPNRARATSSKRQGSGVGKRTRRTTLAILPSVPRI